MIGAGRLCVRIAETLQTTDEFKDLWVEGEVTNSQTNPSGHVYFTLRDNIGQIKCVLFATQAANVPLTRSEERRVGKECRL